MLKVIDFDTSKLLEDMGHKKPHLMILINAKAFIEPQIFDLSVPEIFQLSEMLCISGVPKTRGFSEPSDDVSPRGLPPTG